MSISRRTGGLLGNNAVSFTLLLTVIYLSSENVSCEKLPVISDKSTVTISLKNYNVNHPGGESYEVQYIVKPNSTCQITVTSIPEDVSFVVLQVHSYLNNLTLSYNAVPTRETSVSGMNIGLLKMKSSAVLSFYLLYNTSEFDAAVLIAVQGYGSAAPIPGGCNMEFQVEISPFMRTTVNDAITDVDFAPASLFSSFFPNTNNMCNVKPDPVMYKTYRMYLTERNFSEEMYFNSLKMMMTPGRIQKNGWMVYDKIGTPQTRHLFASYPGTGSVFAVVAETDTGSSVYVPSFTYACHIDRVRNSCLVLTHRFFKIELLLLGLVCGTVVCYVAALRLDVPRPMWTSLGVGAACGIALFVTLCFRGLPLLSLLLATGLLGHLVASSLFYGFVDLFDALESDINYWFLFFSIVLLSPILMLSLSEKGNIIACSIIGGYIAILSIDYYIGSNLRYIIINVIRRATVERFKHAIVDPPFQTKDVVLTSVWLILSMAGITVQYLLIRGRPPYPAPSNPFRPVANRLKAAVAARQKAPSETTPLLRSIA